MRHKRRRKCLNSKAHSPTAGSPAEAPSPSSLRMGGLRRLKTLGQGRNRAWTAVTALLVLVGVLASVLGARAVARSDADKARLAFHLASTEVASSLRLAIQHEEDLVVSASAFFSGNPNASPADFDRWAESVRALQRYPELKDFGLVIAVPASRLAAVEARMAATPLLPLGPQSVGSKEPLRIIPPGNRPYYCLAVAGLARSAATVLPPGLDFCALAPALFPSSLLGADQLRAGRGWRNHDVGTRDPGVPRRGGALDAGGAPAGVRGVDWRAARAQRRVGAGA